MKNSKVAWSFIAVLVGIVVLGGSGCKSKQPPNERFDGGCTYNGASYSDGAHVCQAGYEYVCHGSSWEPTNIKCDREDGALTQGSGVAVMKDRVFQLTVGDSPAARGSGLPQKLGPCCSFFYVSNSQVGIRNNCAECKACVVNWINHGIEKYNVPGYGQITINIVSSTGQIIGEEPCH